MGGSVSAESETQNENQDLSLADKQSPLKKYQKELTVAIEAVTKGSAVAQKAAETLISAETITKKDNSPVTIADFSVQAVIIAELRNAFPDDKIVAEEKSKDISKNQDLKSRIVELTNSAFPGAEKTEEQILNLIDQGDHNGGPEGRFWTIDPIDGTKGYLRKEQYAVCLALIEEGQVVLGAIGCPNLPVNISEPEGPKGSIFVAVKGCGASSRQLTETEFKPISVTKTSDPKLTSFLESVEAAHTAHGDAYEIAKLLKITAPPVRMDSQAKYCSLARGDATIYLRLPTIASYEEKIWDHAAGSLLVVEAGGKVVDTTGTPLDFSQGKTLKHNKGVIASNTEFHSKVLGAVELVLYPSTHTYRVTIKRTPPEPESLHKAIASALSLDESLIKVELESSD
jgi:3'(2'), 5'-bisphosphate nucleotidase